MPHDTSTTDSPPSNAGDKTESARHFGGGKPILCLDFDGVIHSYTSGWKGADVITDDVVAGFFPWLVEAQKVFDVHVFSSRSHQSGGMLAMLNWLYKEAARVCNSGDTIRFLPSFVDAIDSLYWPTHKPPAMVTLDDRALQFQGVWPDVARLQQFRPWNKV